MYPSLIKNEGLYAFTAKSPLETMSLVAAVKAMVRKIFVMDQLDKEEHRLALTIIELERLSKKEEQMAKEQDIKEEDILLYHEVKRFERYVVETKQKISELKAELASSRSQFFSEEEVAELKSEGALGTLLTQLERAEAHKMPLMLKENGAEFIAHCVWTIKDRYW